MTINVILVLCKRLFRFLLIELRESRRIVLIERRGSMYKLQLKELRRRAGFKTQKEIADRLGIKERKYATWEREEVALTLEDAYNLAIVLGCTPNDICGWYEDHPREDGGERLTSEEREIVGCYRESTPQWRQNIAMTARAAAGESKETAKRGVSATEKRAAM